MFTLIFNQLLKMLFIMLLAYFCYKIGLITQEGNRTLSESSFDGCQSLPDHYRLPDTL